MPVVCGGAESLAAVSASYFRAVGAPVGGACAARARCLRHHEGVCVNNNCDRFVNVKMMKAISIKINTLIEPFQSQLGLRTYLGCLRMRGFGFLYSDRTNSFGTGRAVPVHVQNIRNANGYVLVGGRS